MGSDDDGSMRKRRSFRRMGGRGSRVHVGSDLRYDDDGGTM